MADTRSTVNTELKENVGNVSANNILGVYTRTFSFPVVATDDGTAADVLNTITLPANTQVLGIAAKSSVAQTATFAWNITGAAAFGAAAVPGNGVFTPGVVTSTLAVTGASDVVLQAVLGTAICVAGTITVTATCATLGGAPAGYTTYTI